MQLSKTELGLLDCKEAPKLREYIHLSPKSHLHNIYADNLWKATQNIFAYVQDAKKKAIPTR